MTKEISGQKSDFEFIDERIVEHTYLLERKVTPLSKYPQNPIAVNSNGSCGVSLENGIIRMWYIGREAIKGEAPYNGLIPLGERTLRYAESVDGYHWEFPSLGLTTFHGNKRNNILIKKGSTDINGKMLYAGQQRGFSEMACIADTDRCPSARGRHTMFMPENHGCFFYSDDGYKWTAYEENPLLDFGGSDTYNNFFFDHKTNKYFLYHRPHPDLHAGWARANRLIACICSDNLLSWDWGNVRCVLDTDGRDAPAVPRFFKPNEDEGTPHPRGRDIQFDSMTVVPYKDIYLGFAGMIDNTSSGRYETYLLHSYNGVDWIREPYSTPFICSSEFGKWDSGIVGQIPSGCPIVIGDDLIFLYMGSNMTHMWKLMNNEKVEKRGVGVGCVKKGRLAGYHADNVKGEILTRPFLLTEKKLEINADARNGEIRFGVFNADGSPIDEFSQQNCMEIHTDGIDLKATWRNGQDLSSLLNKKLRLRISIENGSIYGFKLLE